jgi:prophage regulatory protein
MADKILRCQAVIELTGLSRSTLYEKMARGEFPKPKKLGRRAVGWLRSDIAEWFNGLPSAHGKQ